MSDRRDEMLKEMGLWPVWRLRPVAAEAAQDSASAVDATLPTDPDAPALASSVTRRDPPATRHRSPVTPSLAPDNFPDDRRARIMRMEWGELKTCVASCVDCELHAKRNKAVFGVGDEKASWLFVGEGPGADEDAQGEPFVGQAGKLLDSMLAAIDLMRGRDVYIANVVKCRPPGNRTPQPQEALACEPYLQRQIELIQPNLIVALGRVAAVNLLAREATIASLRGKVHEYRGIPLIVTYHPAYLLRNLPDKAKAWADLCFAVETMRGLKQRVSAAI